MTDVGDRLAEAARRAAERADRERRQAGAAGPAPRPGDLYALPATAEHDVEWLVVAPAVEGGWVVLPADLAPFGGAADVEVPADEPGGPLTVYGRFPVTVPASLLAPEQRGGRVGEERRAAAERRWRDLAAGSEPPPREGDFDPDYRRRLGELAAAQRALEAAAEAAAEGGPGGGPGGGRPRPAGDGAAAAHEAGGDDSAAGPVPARPSRPSPPRFRPPPWLTALAAGLVLAVVPLAGWNVSLLRRVDRLSGARVVTMGPEVLVDVRERGELAAPDGEVVVFPLVWQEPPRPGERFRFSIVAADGAELTRLEVAPGERSEVLVEVPRAKLPPGARLLLVRLGAGGREERVLERTIHLGAD